MPPLSRTVKKVWRSTSFATTSWMMNRVSMPSYCDRIHVSSFTFQAPGFYARHGYVETGRTEGIPTPENADVHFVKHLD